MEIQGHQLHWLHIGNERVIRCWAAHLASRELAQSYILVGPADVGKAMVAKNFMRTLVCERREQAGSDWPCEQCETCRQTARGIYPDFYELDVLPDKQKISIDQVRQLLDKIGLSSLANNYEVALIRHADRLSEPAANALLKNLEEPQAQALFIFLVENLSSLPATIVSRSQVFRFYPVAADLIYDHLVSDWKTNRDLAKNLAQVCLGRPNLAIRFLEQPELFQDYCQTAKILLQLIMSPVLADRLAYLRQIYPFGAISAGEPEWRLWRMWLGLIRDLLLIKQDQLPLIQHWFLRDELEKAVDSLSWSVLLKIFTNLGAAREYLTANVSPSLVFHNLAVGA